MNRSKALKLNMVTNLFCELVTLISGLILPRLVLLYFGSSCNGLVSSISQFLGFSVILRSGMGGAIRAALYKPLAENDSESLDGIMAATDKYMKKIGAIIGAAILVFSIVYPFLVREEYDWFFAFSMVLIIGSSTFIDNFFGIKCKILLQADQKYYIQIGASAITSVFTAITSAVLMISHCPIQVVKIGAAVAALANPIMLNAYVRKRYNINWNAKPNELALKQKWDAFFQQVAVVVNENVDLVLLTIFVTLKEVSVYTVYYMVVNNIGKIVNSCVSGINSTFGNIIASKEKDNLKRVFLFIEWALFSISVVLYSVTAVMLPGFITLYTASVEDVNYIRPAFAVVMVVVTMISSTRIPYQMLAEAAGKFKETRNGAILEAILNIISSVILVHFFGIIGVLLGTLLAGTIRTIEYAVFCMKNILEINWLHIVKHYLILFATFSIAYFAGKQLLFISMDNYISWVINAALVTVCSGLIAIVVGVVFYKDSVRYLVNRIRKR